MPNRILRDSWLTSESIDSLSAEGERFFARLLLVTDDWGRFEANPKVLLSRLFPMKIGSHTLASVTACLHELTSAGMVQLYRENGREYGAILSWAKHNKLRAKTSKYPPPPVDTCERPPTRADRCEQMLTYTDSDSDSESDADSDAEVKKDSSEPLADSRSEPAPQPAEPVLLEFPCIGKGPRVWGLTEPVRSDLASAYPGVDVLSEGRRAIAWLRANPTKAKTFRGMPRFLNGWLSRQQDSGRAGTRGEGGLRPNVSAEVFRQAGGDDSRRAAIAAKGITFRLE